MKLLDFGLARQAEAENEVTSSGAFIGTPSYMSPEQANGDPVDGRSDLFSLGVLLYRLTTGKLPFTGPTVMATIAALATKDPTSVSSLKSDCPKGLADLIHRLLSKNREHRPASAKIVADELLKLDSDDTKSLMKLPPILECLPVADHWASINDIESGINNIQSVSTNNKTEILSQPKDNKQVVAKRDKPFWIAVLLVMILISGYFISKLDYKGENVSEFKSLDDAKFEGNGRMVISESPKNSAVHLPKTFTNSIGMEFVLVGKGTCWLGGGYEKQGENKVDFDQDFYLGKYEVTQEEWEVVTGENPSHFSRNKEGKDFVKDIKDEDLKRFPVEYVSWNDCQLFIDRLNQREKKSGRVYRLPLEEEWEYASRGGPSFDKSESSFDFYFAKPANQLLPDQANFAPDSEKGQKGLQRTCKVGSYKPNQLGLYDMHGNVWELCANLYAIDGVTRANRGGSWSSDADNCRSAYRGTVAPSSRYINLGFRLVLIP